jgi:hypothetical protein
VRTVASAVSAGSSHFAVEFDVRPTVSVNGTLTGVMVDARGHVWNMPHTHHFRIEVHQQKQRVEPAM